MSPSREQRETTARRRDFEAEHGWKPLTKPRNDEPRNWDEVYPEYVVDLEDFIDAENTTAEKYEIFDTHFFGPADKLGPGAHPVQFHRWGVYEKHLRREVAESLNQGKTHDNLTEITVRRRRYFPPAIEAARRMQIEIEDERSPWVTDFGGFGTIHCNATLEELLGADYRQRYPDGGVSEVGLCGVLHFYDVDHSDWGGEPVAEKFENNDGEPVDEDGELIDEEPTRDFDEDEPLGLEFAAEAEIDHVDDRRWRRRKHFSEQVFVFFDKRLGWPLGWARQASEYHDLHQPKLREGYDGPKQRRERREEIERDELGDEHSADDLRRFKSRMRHRWRQVDATRIMALDAGELIRTNGEAGVFLTWRNCDRRISG